MRLTLRLPLLSNPSRVAQIEVNLACRCICMQRNYSYSRNVEHPYGMMPSQSPHPVASLVVRNVRSLANRQNQQKHGSLGNSQLPTAMKRVSVPAGEKDSPQEWSSVASTIQGQISTPSFSLNNSRIADATQCLTSTPSATPQRSIITPTAMPGTSSRNAPEPSGITGRFNASRSIQPRIRHC